MSLDGFEPGRHVVFLLGDGRFAVPVRLVQEILVPPPITPIPGAPPWLLGVFNRRGDIMSAVDVAGVLRAVRREQPGAAARLLIVATSLFPVGVHVDSVEEIIQVAPGDTVAAELGTGRTAHVPCAVLRSGRLISIVNLEPILTSGEMLAYR